MRRRVPSIDSISETNMNKKLSAAIVAATSTLIATIASAHVSTNAGSPAPAGGSQEITLQIAHGCSVEGQTTMTDTSSLKVDIPAGVTSVRAVSSTDFPNVTVDKDGSGNVTAITWAKVPGSELDADTNFYKLTFRAKMPNAPFTKIYFKAHQKCKAPGKDAEWIGIPGDTSGAEPAPEVIVLPAKTPGWNKFTVPVAVAAADMKSYFNDAQIVWKGTAAFSANAVTADQITKEPGVTPLTELAANDEIFVKY
jgi:uncharacterized protein YcnI